MALILPHKSLLGFNGVAIGADISCDRSGILYRTTADCANIIEGDPRNQLARCPQIVTAVLEKVQEILQSRQS